MDRPYRYFKSIKEFEFLGELGKGSFGTVLKALHITTSQLYAIKIIQLQKIGTKIGVEALKREKNIHKQLDHPHVVKLWEIFEENGIVYLVLEYVDNGNLFYYQNSRNIFSEAEALAFFSQTLSAVEYLHDHNYMHRDLKPENLLIDKDFNVKICDFGWIISGIHEKRKIFCGTYQYMAPEMIFDQEYDYRIDIWALGILLHELLHGFAPFEGDTVAEVRSSMIKGEIQLNSQLSQSVKSLIFGILKVNPDERLSINEIKSHNWLKRHEKIVLKQIRGFSTGKNLTKNLKTLALTGLERHEKWDKDNDSPQFNKQTKQMKDQHMKKVKNSFLEAPLPEKQSNTKQHHGFMSQQKQKSFDRQSGAIKTPQKTIIISKKNCSIDTIHSIKHHRPQISDIGSYGPNIKKSSRFKTQGTQFNSSKLLSKLHTQINCSKDFRPDRKRKLGSKKLNKYKKNLPSQKIIQVYQPYGDKKSGKNKSKATYNSIRRSLD